MKTDYDKQPLDEVMIQLGLRNDDLVSASSEQLTHKQVQKGRLGRRITPNIKGKIVRALIEHTGDTSYTHKSLFNY